MPQLISIASAQVPWLLPAVGVALFVHKHFLCFNGAGSQVQARVRAGARSRPPKLKRKRCKSAINAAADANTSIDRQQEQLDAAGLGHDKVMEWFTEDEVEALHQVQANPAALMSLLAGSRFAAMDDNDENDEDDSHWSTDGGLGQGLSSHILEPVKLVQDSGVSPMSGTSLEQHEFPLQHSVQLQGQQQNAAGAEQRQVQLTQQLLLHMSKVQQRHGEQQPICLQLLAAASTSGDTAAPDATAAPQSTISGVTASEYGDGGDYFDPNDYFALSPVAAKAGRSQQSPRHFIPRAGALWATSYPPRFGEHTGDIWDPDFVPDFEPDLGDMDWDLDALEYDPGFDPTFGDEGLLFDVDVFRCDETDNTPPQPAGL